MKKKIILAAGGTGGHVFPAVCVADILAIDGVDVGFVTDQRGLRYCGQYSSEAVVLNITMSSRFSLYFSILKNTLFLLVKFVWSRPHSVVGFGGYPSVAPVLAAQILGIKTVLHEQNAVVGKANKMLSKFCQKIITSFPETKNIKQSPKVAFVGNPTRFEKQYSLYQNIANESQCFCVLIFGGSQGAKIFSENIVEAMCLLSQAQAQNQAKNQSQVRTFKIYHQSRAEDKDGIRKKYAEYGIDSVVDNFFDNIDELYQKASIVIARSGASSIFEIVGFRKPAILIPYKKSINGDQQANAMFLKNHNAAIVLDESEISPENLCNIVSSLIVDQAKLNDISLNLNSLFVADIGAKVCLEIQKILPKTSF